MQRSQNLKRRLHVGFICHEILSVTTTDCARTILFRQKKISKSITTESLCTRNRYNVTFGVPNFFVNACMYSVWFRGAVNERTRHYWTSLMRQMRSCSELNEWSWNTWETKSWEVCRVIFHQFCDKHGMSHHDHFFTQTSLTQISPESFCKTCDSKCFCVWEQQYWLTAQPTTGFENRQKVGK